MFIELLLTKTCVHDVSVRRLLSSDPLGSLSPNDCTNHPYENNRTNATIKRYL